MDIAEVLNENLINLKLQAGTKVEAIEELIELLYQEGKVSDCDLFLRDVYDREAEGRTGIGKHVAIPHGKSDAVANTSIVIGRTMHDLVWESLDDKPVHIVILFAVRKEDKTKLHLRLLAQVACALADEEVLKRLLITEDKQEVIALLTGDE
ncbi:PTS sugar transporter subunit IIA [Anaerosinus massiliensis]|uniref:PTS sugar transporter subunit IIA n=1 Tax=Massilibacillus massiliensis TaxID=1806837 RepID=UPI000A3FC857|nr:fructose PTS transporter subunit IIA [Massilibacillus massiliensis]